MFLEQKHKKNRCSPVSGLNNLMILHVRKDHTDLLNEIDVANEFVGEDYGCLENSNNLIETLLCS